MSSTAGASVSWPISSSTCPQCRACPATRGCQRFSLAKESTASRVMMIPIHRAGVLRAVEGQQEARSAPGAEYAASTAEQPHTPSTRLPSGQTMPRPTWSEGLVTSPPLICRVPPVGSCVGVACAHAALSVVATLASLPWVAAACLPVCDRVPRAKSRGECQQRARSGPQLESRDWKCTAGSPTVRGSGVRRSDPPTAASASRANSTPSHRPLWEIRTSSSATPKPAGSSTSSTISTWRETAWTARS
jgi:hypothetical protein